MKDDLVARRQKYIERQIALDKGAVNVNFAGHRPEGRGPANRHGMPKLPVGQHEVKNWPVLDLGEQPHISRATWKLEVGGLVESPFTLTWDRFMALPQVDEQRRIVDLLEDHLSRLDASSPPISPHDVRTARA